MEAECAEHPLAPDEEPTQQPTEVAAVSATAAGSPPVPLPTSEAPSADLGSVKEEVDFSDPAEPVAEVQTYS